jgi:hypothetical protein
MIAISQRVYSSALNSWGNFLRYIRSDNISQPVSAYKYSDFVKMGKQTCYNSDSV